MRSASTLALRHPGVAGSERLVDDVPFAKRHGFVNVQERAEEVLEGSARLCQKVRFQHLDSSIQSLAHHRRSIKSKPQASTFAACHHTNRTERADLRFEVRFAGSISANRHQSLHRLLRFRVCPSASPQSYLSVPGPTA